MWEERARIYGTPGIQNNFPYFLCESINKLNKTTIQNLKKKIKPKKKEREKENSH